MAESIKEFGIVYRVINLSPNLYILVPKKVVEGKDTEVGFETTDGVYSFANQKNDYQNQYVVDKIFAQDELELIYEYKGDSDFLKDYFYEEHKDTVFFVDTSQDGFMVRNEINLRVINTQGKDASFFMEKDIPVILLNENALKELLQAKSLSEIQLLIERYKGQLGHFENFYKNRGLTRLNLENGKIASVEVDRKTEIQTRPVVSTVVPPAKDVSYPGLRTYLKERIFGHDEAIDTFAQKLYMNYTAEKGESVESIMFVGPTGTGKTETVRAACSYLGIPFVEANASNIVPQGIKGMSIEDIICNLYEAAGKDLKRAERGLIFLDEFDKLNDSDLDLKTSVKNILLTFTAGGVFPIDTDHYHFHFDSFMTNKVYAGVFEKIQEQRKTMGFNSSLLSLDRLGTEEQIRREIVKKNYFTLEELTRISTILGYNELSRNTKRKILLYAKNSELLQKKKRYKRQFGIDLIAEEDFIEALLDSIDPTETGMRSIINHLKTTLNTAEKGLLEEEGQHHKQLVLTRETVEDPTQYRLS